MAGLASRHASLRKARSDDLRPTSLGSISTSPPKEAYSAWLEKLPSAAGSQAGIETAAAQTLLDQWLSGKDIKDIPPPSGAVPPTLRQLPSDGLVITSKLDKTPSVRNDQRRLEVPSASLMDRRWSLPGEDVSHAVLDLRGVGAFAPPPAMSQMRSSLSFSFSQLDEPIPDAPPSSEEAMAARDDPGSSSQDVSRS